MTTYSISLDDVDLALLPIHSPSNNFLKKELYEFRVMKADEDYEDSSVNELYFCHICAIEVPSEFSNTHNNGQKHQCNVKIATEASKRMRELLTSNPPIATQSRGKFCDPCASGADENHEKTKEHKVAVVHDKMLSELSNLYVGEDCESDKRNADIKLKVVANKTQKVNRETNIINVLENSEDITVKDTVKTKPKAVGHKQTQTVNVANAEANGDVKDTEYVRISMTMYLKILKSIPFAPKLALKAVNGNVQITVNDDKLIVSSEHFHGLFNREDGDTTCLVCNIVIQKGEEEVHKLVLAHMKAILQVVEDSHCIRQINEHWSHCILCNSKVPIMGIEAHKTNESHLQIQQVCIASFIIQEIRGEINEVRSQITSFQPQNNAQKPALQENTAKIANVNIPKRAANIPKIDKVVLAPNQKIPVNAVKAEVKNALEPVKIITEVHSVFPVEERIEYPFEPRDLSSVLCKICSCAVPRPVANRKGHLNGQRHAANVKKHFPALNEW